MSMDKEAINIYNLKAERDALAAENKVLRDALEKIADWNAAWGPFPETNPLWCSMAVVTARELTKEATNG